MKNSTFSSIIAVLLLLFFCVGTIYVTREHRMQLALQKPYSVTIIHGTPMISYNAILQVDSLKYISKESMIVYLNGSSLWIKADFITFKKN